MDGGKDGVAQRRPPLTKSIEARLAGPGCQSCSSRHSRGRQRCVCHISDTDSIQARRLRRDSQPLLGRQRAGLLGCLLAHAPIATAPTGRSGAHKARPGLRLHLLCIAFSQNVPDSYAKDGAFTELTHYYQKTNFPSLGRGRGDVVDNGYVDDLGRA